MMYALAAASPPFLFPVSLYPHVYCGVLQMPYLLFLLWLTDPGFAGLELKRFWNTRAGRVSLLWFTARQPSQGEASSVLAFQKAVTEACLMGFVLLGL